MPSIRMNTIYIPFAKTEPDPEWERRWSFEKALFPSDEEWKPFEAFLEEQGIDLEFYFSKFFEITTSLAEKYADREDVRVTKSLSFDPSLGDEAPVMRQRIFVALPNGEADEELTRRACFICERVIASISVYYEPL